MSSLFNGLAEVQLHRQAAINRSSRKTLPTIEIHGVPFSFDSDIKAWGYAFERDLNYDDDEPIEYWRAQLALRGFSSRGNDINALKQRLENANTYVRDPNLFNAYMEALQKQAQGKKRKANERLEDNRPAPAARAAPAARPIAATRPPTSVTARPAGFVVNRRLAETDPTTFLIGAFFNAEGKDAGYPPIVLDRLMAANRSHLHQAASSLRLFHQTSINNVMVLGSGRNRLGQQSLNELNLGNNSILNPSVPDVQADDEEEEDDEDEEEDAEDQFEWDITGNWKIQCPGMAGCFGQYSPYTMKIYTIPRRAGKETYGEFDFGEYKGVFRFSTRRQLNRLGNGYYDDTDEFLLDADDNVSADDPMRYYRWRGKEMGEQVIQLGSESYLYKMTFSHGGKKVSGTWGHHDADPGDVTFTGRKISELGNNIPWNTKSQWDNYDEAAYDRANRDRWRNRY